MYWDADVMEIDSDSPDTGKINNKNATAGIDHFFDPVKHVKGDKCGWCRCISCM